MPSEVFQDLWETIQKGETWEGEIKNLAKNGHYYWVEANISQEFDTNGNFIGYISIRQEITAQKNFEKQQSIILQEAKMESLSEMIENIAHQWRQPLNTISVSASGLGMKDEMNVLKEGDIQSFTKTVVENTNYLSQTIETFSNFVKKDNKEILTLQDEICGAINIVRTTMDNHNIKLLDDINYEDITTQNIISGELSQVLINIFKNAKDILIEQDKEDKWIIVNLLQSDSKITLTIEDNGGGIPKDIIDKIFEPYFTTRHQYQGKGLGLHLSHKIITESLNGNIYVKNTKNGAKFFIELPIEN
jgi:signal transduction histidine kinase